MEGCMVKKSSVVLVMSLILLGMATFCVVDGDPQVPCFFIFGDSLVDNGNNNRFFTFAKADYFPYGIDFPAGPTGRFSNGKTMVDVLAELLGFDDYIPPYSASSGEAILKGVNYASAAAGIREETGRLLGARTSFSGQVHNYQNTVSQMVNLLGDENRAADHLKRCIYSIELGNNDYLNNYFMPHFYSSSSQFTPEQFADDLINRYREQLNALYNYGARKFVLFGVGAVGCSPSELARNSTDGRTCVERINSANRIFNDKLRSLVDQLNNNDTDAKFIYINSYGLLEDLINNAFSYGFRVANAGCCGVGRNNALLTCLIGQNPCPNRSEYVFWDAFHLTETANTIVARRAYNAESTLDAYPMDVRRLALA